MTKRTNAIARFFVQPVIFMIEELIRLKEANTIIIELTDLQKRLEGFSGDEDLKSFINKIQEIKDLIRQRDEANPLNYNLIVQKIIDLQALLNEPYSIEVHVFFDGKPHKMFFVIAPRIGEKIEMIDGLFVQVENIEYHLDGTIMMFVTKLHNPWC